MKAIPCYLICYTSWGSVCRKQEFPSMSKAHTEGKWMVEEGFAFDYKVHKLKKK